MKSDNNLVLKIILLLLVVVATGLLIAEIAVLISRENNLIDSTAITDNKNGSEDPSSIGEVLEFTHSDEMIPPTTYTIKLNLGLGEIQVSKYASCSAEDCEGSKTSQTVSLTNGEIEKLRTIINNSYDEGTLAEALDLISQGDKVLVKKTIDPEIWEQFEKSDLDNDGIVTYRESGNASLNDMIKNF